MMKTCLKFLSIVFVMFIFLHLNANAQSVEREKLIERLRVEHKRTFKKAASIESFSQIYNANPDDIDIKYVAYMSALELMINTPTMESFKRFNFAFPNQPDDLAYEIDWKGDLLYRDPHYVIFEGSGTYARDIGYVLSGVGRTELTSGVFVTGVFNLTPYIDGYDFDGEPIFITQDPNDPKFSEITQDAFISYNDGDGIYAYCICKRVKGDRKWKGFKGVLWEGKEQYVGEFNEDGEPHGNGTIINEDGTSEEVVYDDGVLQ